MRCMHLELPVESEASWKEKNQVSYINAYIWNLDNGTDEPSRTGLWTQWGKMKVG